MRVDDLAVLDRAAEVGQLRLEDVERPGRAALARGVEQHERVVAAHELVGEVEPARADVHDGHPGRHPAVLQAPRALRAEGVVLQPGVADAGDEDLLLELAASWSGHLHLGGLEVQVPADVAHEVLAGVVVDGHAEVHVVVVVDVGSARSSRVRPSSRWSCGVGGRAAGRRTTCPPRRKRPAVDDDPLLAADVGVGAVGGRRRLGSLTVTRPWRSMMSCGVGAAARCDHRPAPRGRRRRARARSASLSASTCSSSASSISVESNRLPAALGRDLGMVGQDDRRAQDRVVRRASRAPGTC